MPVGPQIKTKEFPFLAKALKSKSVDLKMPAFALLIGAGCSYRSGIPLGSQVTELLQMECFKRDNISDSKAEFPIEAGFDFEVYKKAFNDYLRTNDLEKKYKEFMFENKAMLEQEVDALTEKQNKAIIPPSLLNKQAVSDHTAFIKTWFDEHKDLLYADYAYGYWFMQYSPSQRERSQLLETLIEKRSTGYGYTCLANAINEDHIRNIFTTNFDDLLNDALSQYFFRNSRVIAHAELAEHINFHNHNPNIIKLHGDYLFADLRNTPTEINANPLTEKMKDAFRDFGLIVIGYGGADYAIMNALEQAKDPNNPYKLIWCDRREPEALHWRVKHLLDTENSFYIKVENFDVLMVQISEALGLRPPDIVTKAREKQEEFDKFYDEAKKATQASNLPDKEKAELKQQLSASEYFSKAYSAKTPDEKIEYYTKAIELKPEYADAYYNRGIAWRNKGEYDKAIADYNKAIDLKPEDAQAYNNRGVAWGNKKEYDKAIADYSKAIELQPDYAEAYNNRGITWGEKSEYDRAIADYSNAIELQPEYATAYYDRGNAWSKKKEYDKAIADFNKAIGLKPEFADVYCNRGIAWGDKMEYDKAITDFNKAIELKPEYSEPYNNRGIAWQNKKEYDKALADYLQAEKLEEGSAAYNLACFYSVTGKTDMALQWIEKALQLREYSREEIEADADFDNIRKLPQYKELLDKYRALK